jgi:basic membrane protein A and related proteins
VLANHRLRRSLALGVAGLVALAAACTPPPAAPSAPTAAPAGGVTPAPTAAAKPTTGPAAPTAPAAQPTAAPVANASPAAAAAGAAPSSCKIAQVYSSPTTDKGWSWAHNQAFLAVQKDLPYVDLTIRKDSVPDDNKQAVEDLLESMVQQGAKAVYTLSFGYMEPTRAVAARHPDVAFFHASGFPDPKDPPNIGYYFATIEEARYVSGEVAGLAVDPGANIGYVAAFPIPEVFRGENAFALGVMKTNPTAKVYNKWTLTWFDPKLEKDAAESLLEPPTSAALLAQHQDSSATQLAAQDAGKLGIAYDADQNDVAPKATLTAPIWHWEVQNKPTIQGVCSGAWTRDGKVTLPTEYKNWMGSTKDGTVDLAPLNTQPLANNPRKDDIQKLYESEKAAFKAGQKNFETVFTGPIKDNTGAVKIESKPDVAALYDDRGQWFVENVVGSPHP